MNVLYLHKYTAVRKKIACAYLKNMFILKMCLLAV